MLRRWISESGVSRGISTRRRSSFNATDAARWIRFVIAPEAIVPSVPIEHGQRTYASTFAEPLAYGDFQSLGSYTVKLPPREGSSSRSSVSSRESRALPYSSVASTSMPALDAQIPSSTSAPASASTSRAAYGAPEAPVMPRKTRTAGLFWTLGREEKRRQLGQLLIGEPELRHDVVAELRGVADVRHELLLRLPSRGFRAQIGRTLVRAAGAEIGMAGGATGAGEDLRSGDRLRVADEALSLCP